MGEHVNKRRLVISSVENDGTIIETVYQPDASATAFAVAWQGKIEIVPEVHSADAISVPIRATNNLIRHSVLVLPSEPAEYGDTGTLLIEIESYLQRYVALSTAATVLSASYILLSWVYDAFNELPYLRFRGDYGTGKTRALFVVGALCHKAFFASGASTISPIFHTLDTFKGTLIFDEADFRFTDEKAELVKILNNGNVRGFPVLRTQVTTKNEFDPRAFSIFGPKIVGMRRAYEDRALESRFLTIEMEPGRSSGVPINLPESQRDEALILRNKLLMYRLRSRLTVQLEPVLADLCLEPRMNQILLPLLSIIPDAGRRATILAFARTLQAALMAERGTTTDAQVLTVLRTFLLDRSNGPISLAEIATAFAEKFGAEYDRPITNRWIGSILRRLGIILYKSNGVITMLSGQTERVEALCDRYGVGDTVGKVAA